MLRNARVWLSAGGGGTVSAALCVVRMEMEMAAEAGTTKAGSIHSGGSGIYEPFMQRQTGNYCHTRL